MISRQTKAEYYLMRRDYKSAFREYRAVLDKGKRNSKAHFGIGIALMGMGRLKLARRHLESAERYGRKVRPEIWQRLNALRERRVLGERQVSKGLSFSGSQIGKSARKRRKARRRSRSRPRGTERSINYDKVPGGGYLHSAPSRGSIRLIG